MRIFFLPQTPFRLLPLPQTCFFCCQVVKWTGVGIHRVLDRKKPTFPPFAKGTGGPAVAKVCSCWALMVMMVVVTTSLDHSKRILTEGTPHHRPEDLDLRQECLRFSFLLFSNHKLFFLLLSLSLSFDIGHRRWWHGGPPQPDCLR